MSSLEEISICFEYDLTLKEVRRRIKKRTIKA